MTIKVIKKYPKKTEQNKGKNKLLKIFNQNKIFRKIYVKNTVKMFVVHYLYAYNFILFCIS